MIVLALNLVHYLNAEARYTSAVNVTLGDEFFLPCGIREVKCYPNCVYIKVTLYKKSQKSDSKIFEFVKLRDSPPIRKPENGRFTFDEDKVMVKN